MNNDTKNPNDIPYEASEVHKIDFCKDWPCAKRALEALKEIIKVDYIKKIIEIIISVGDYISGKICT